MPSSKRCCRTASSYHYCAARHQEIVGIHKRSFNALTSQKVKHFREKDAADTTWWKAIGELSQYCLDARHAFSSNNVEMRGITVASKNSRGTIRRAMQLLQLGRCGK